MRAYVILGLFVASSASCAPPTSTPEPRAAVEPAGAKAEIGPVLDDFHDAAAKADFARYFAHLAEDSVFLGTDASERWTKQEFMAYSKPHFDKGKAWSFRATRREVVVGADGEIGWFDEDLDTVGLGPARGSGVVARRLGRWVILHYNLTITVPNERFGAVKEAAGAAVVRGAAPDDDVVRLAWLSGAWIGTTQSGERFEESWLPPAGDTMIGSGRATKEGNTVFFEHLRVQRREGKLVYVAQPLGGASTEFTELPSSDDRSASFENRLNPWPKRVTYRRTDDGVAVRLEGSPGERVEEWTMRPAVIVRREDPAPAR